MGEELSQHYIKNEIIPKENEDKLAIRLGKFRRHMVYITQDFGHLRQAAWVMRG